MRKETNKTERIQAALRVKHGGIEHELERMEMILDEDMTQNLRKELKELKEKNEEENDNLCHE